MKRTEAREQIFKVIFQLGFYDEEHIVEQIDIYLDNLEEEIKSIVTEKDRQFIVNEVEGTLANLKDIDEIISKSAKGWKLSRLSKVDLNILRLAIYEIKHDDSIPVNVSINEAINLAKKYSSDEAPAFINGVLGHVVL